MTQATEELKKDVEKTKEHLLALRDEIKLLRRELAIRRELDCDAQHASSPQARAEHGAAAHIQAVGQPIIEEPVDRNGQRDTDHRHRASLARRTASRATCSVLNIDEVSQHCLPSHWFLRTSSETHRVLWINLCVSRRC